MLVYFAIFPIFVNSPCTSTVFNLVWITLIVHVADGKEYLILIRVLVYLIVKQLSVFIQKEQAYTPKVFISTYKANVRLLRSRYS